MIAGRWALLPLVALLVLTAGGRAQSQSGPSLSIDPASQTVSLGDGAFEVRLMVDDVTTAQGLGGYTLVMNYDSDVVHALTITDSGFVASTDNAVVCPASAIDNGAGRLAQFCFTIPIFAEPGPQTTEPQILARLTFEPLGVGTTTLDISDTTLADPQGNGILTTTQNGQVTVQPGAASPSNGDSDSEPPSGPAEGGPAADQAAGRDQATGSAAFPPSGAGYVRGPNTMANRIALALAGVGVITLLGGLAIARRGRHLPRTEND